MMNPKTDDILSRCCCCQGNLVDFLCSKASDPLAFQAGAKQDGLEVHHDTAPLDDLWLNLRSGLCSLCHLVLIAIAFFLIFHSGALMNMICTEHSYLF